MKKLLLISVLLTLHQGLFAQKNFSYPFGETDIRVLASTAAGSKLSLNTISHAGRDTVIVHANRRYAGVRAVLGSYIRVRTLAIDSNDVLIEVNKNSSIEELFPLNVIARDTFHLRTYHVNSAIVDDSSLCIIEQRFDTTIFGKTVSAYRMLRMNTSDTTQVIVADTFGIIQKRMWDKMNRRFSDPSVLSSAKIGGVRYNRDSRRFRMMSLCVGNMYQYYYQYRIRSQLEQTGYQTCTMTDTLVNGTVYFRCAALGDMLLREGDEGVYAFNGVDALYLPDDLSIGSVLNMNSIQYPVFMVITDTTTLPISSAGSTLLFKARGASEGDNFIMLQPLFGIVHRLYWDPFFIPINQRVLTYANVCGKEFGNLVHVDEPDVTSLSSFILSQNYPNPFSEKTKIDLTPTLSYEERELHVFDLFGREVLDLSEQAHNATEIVIYRSQLPRAGVYFYRLTAPRFSMTKKMLLMD